MNNTEYHADSAWSQSAVKLLPRHPERFYAEHIAKTIQREPSASFELGSAVHGLLSGCEPVVEVPADALTSNGQRRGKAWEQFQADNAGAILLLPSTYATAQAMADSVRTNRIALRLLEAEGLFEQSLFYTDELTGLRVKARPDKLACMRDTTVIVDIKTTRDDPASVEDIAWSIHRYGYAFQAAWYRAVCHGNGYAADAFAFIFVSSEPPHVCRCYELSERAMIRGGELCRVALDDLRERLESNDWRGDDADACPEIDLPERIYKENVL